MHRWPRPRPGWLPLLACAALSVGLHAALLATLRPQPGAMSASTRATTAWMSARVLPAPAGPAESGEPATVAVAAAAPTASVAPPRAPQTASEAASAPLPAPAAPARPSAAPPSPAVAAPAVPAPDGLALVQEEYLPRSRLSMPPTPMGTVPIALALDAVMPLDYSGVFVVFIDEQGTVRDVRAEGDAEAPPALLRAVRDAFASARFRPGERDGTPVKSRIRIEVSNRRAPGVPGAAPAS